MTITVMLEWIFWLSAAGVVYGYIGYSLALRVLLTFISRPVARAAIDAPDVPTVTMLIPVHNERSVIGDKVRNVQAIEYPDHRLEVLFACDGCTDGTVEFLRQYEDDRIAVLDLPRGGKAAALNSALEAAHGEIVVFTDASIMLEREALRQIVRPFASPQVGCVSGEDVIAQAGGEGLYGRYELAIRRLESQLHSIVGASGSFYAQRRALCQPFLPGLAPDFLSVLRTIDQGFRAIAEPRARGVMTELGDPRAEFGRKVRTILRGITTLVQFRRLLNPFRHGWFAFELFSHKLMRWLAPLFLVLLVISSALLAGGSRFFLAILVLQMLFYALAGLALWNTRTFAAWLPAKVSLYFTSANVATASAWFKFFMGSRQELWSPSRR